MILQDRFRYISYILIQLMVASQKSNTILKFHYILNIYSTSFYGSGLWDVFGASCEKFYTSWNMAVRNIFNLPWTTHRYWIENISNCLHPKVMLCSRYVKFHQSLISSKKSSVRFLSRLLENDRRTVFGRTLSHIKSKCEVATNKELSANLVKSKMKYFSVPEVEQWRADPLHELLLARQGHLGIDIFTREEIDCIQCRRNSMMIITMRMRVTKS